MHCAAKQNPLHLLQGETAAGINVRKGAGCTFILIHCAAKHPTQTLYHITTSILTLH